MQLFKDFDGRLIDIISQSELIIFVFLFVMVLLSSINAANIISKIKQTDDINDILNDMSKNNNLAITKASQFLREDKYE